MRNNLFIAFEGIDGSGKSTQIQKLAERLRENGKIVETTFEPTNGLVGIVLRNILKGSVKADERTIAALFLADRLDHLLKKETGVIQMLENGLTVITDRYYFSSYAYHGCHVPMEWVINSNEICASIRRPDVNIFIDVPPEVAIQRIQRNRDSMEIYETLENLKMVRDKYEEAFSRLSGLEKVIIVNGNQDSEAVSEAIWSSIHTI